MKSYFCDGNFNSKNAHLKFNIIVFSFVDEKNIHFIYSPQLDITTYGNTEDEAKEAFEIHTKEFFKYTIENNTLTEVLSDLGWSFNGEKIEAPSITHFMEKDSLLPTVLESYPVSSHPRSFDIQTRAFA